jgi:hypothetical protein
MLLLTGYSKTGKDRLVNHWLGQLKRDEADFILPYQGRVLKIDELWQPERRTSSTAIYATPVACILFSEIAFAMGEILRRLGSSFADRTWYRQPKSLHSDIQFASLFSFVRSDLSRLRACLLIINNAQWLDRCSLERLMQLRRHFHGHLGIILMVQLQTNATLDEPLEEEFRHVPEAADICQRVEIKRLTEDEYKAVILGALVDDLDLDVDDELLPHEHDIANLFWQLTGPDWKLIQDKLARPLDKAVGERNGKPRLITREALTRVIGKPLPF